MGRSPVFTAFDAKIMTLCVKPHLHYSCRLELPDNGWYSKFKSAIGDDGPSGNYLTTTEYNNVWSGLNDTKSQEAVRHFLRRWNNTVLAFNQGTLASRPDTENVVPLLRTQEMYDQYVRDTSAAKEVKFT